MRRPLLITLFVLLSICKSNAQGTAGKDFWVAFMAQDWYCYYNNNYYNNDTAEIFLSSQYAANVTVTAPGQNFSRSVTLQPNVTKMVRLPREVVCRYSDTVTTNGVRIQADTIINVYAVNRYWWSKGATVVIPTASIVYSPEYFITTNDDTYNWGWSCNGKTLQSPEFVIVGIADSSVIEVVPTGASSRFSQAGVPFQITLKKGETFQYMTSDRDLTGSIVRSKYIYSKFSVFAGNRQTFTNRTIGNQTCYSSWDHNYEQMMPTVNWGQNYTALPFKNNVKGYTLKIIAAENNSNIYINGSYLTQLNQGGYYTYQVYNDTVLRISSNNRISVAQFALGGYSCQNHPTKYWIGDPAQVQLFPDEQFGTSATVNTVSQTPFWWWYNNWWWQQNSPEHYINVMTKTPDTAFFQHNNVKLKNSAWKTAPNFSGYHFAQIQIDTGSHYIKSTKGFLSYVYGYGWYEGYAYAAAANFRPIQNNFVIINAQCKRDTVKFNAITNDSFQNYSWKFGDGGTATGTKVQRKYADTGWYTVKMYCYHKRTNAKDSVTKLLYVADTKIKSLFNKDTAICGKVNYVVISKGFNIDNEYRWNDGHQVYYRAVKNPGVLWLEVKERNGCTLRDTLIVSNSTIPKANFKVSNDSFCLNRNINVKYTNHSSFKDSIKHFRWDFGDTVMYTKDTNTALFYKFKRANMYPIVLRAETKFGCYHDTFMVVDVLPSPKANFTFSKKDTCFNTNGIELKNNTIINKNDHRRYKWYFTEGFVQSNSNPGPRSYTATGDYKVMLIYENFNGCIDTMRQNVKVVPNPKAGFTYPNAIYCTLDTINFNSTSTSNIQPLRYRWTWSDNTNSIDSASKKAFVSKGNNAVKLVVTAPTGCRDSIIRTLFVNETPVVDFTINKDTQCFNGHNFNFVNSTKFSGGSLNYSWVLGDATSATDSNVLNKKYIKDSTYTIRLSTTTSAGCNASKSRLVYLGKYPNVQFTINKDTQCFRNNLFNFTNTSQIAKGSILSYSWDMGNSVTSAGKDISNHRYATEDTFTVRLIGKSNLGCLDTAFRNVVTFAQAKSGFAVNSAVQCLNKNAYSFTNSSSLKYGTLNYTWTFGDNTSAISKDAKRTYSNFGSYFVSLISNTEHNCRDTAVRLITVNASPKAGIAVNAAKQCFKGNQFVYNSSSTIPSGSIAKYFWSFGDSESDTLRNTRHSYSTEDTFNTRLIVVSDQNCADTTFRQVIAHPQAKAAFAVNNDVQCFKQHKFVFTNQTSVKRGLLSYNWSFGDASNSTDTNFTKKYLKDSVYNIRLIASTEHSCKDTAYKTIVLNVSPDAVYTIAKDKQCFRGNNFNFTNQSSVRKGNIVAYEWQMGDGNTRTTAGVSNYIYASEDTFKVKLIAQTDKNCFDTLMKPAITFAQPNVKFIIPNDSQCWQKNFFNFNNQTKLKYGTLTNSWDFGDNTFSNQFAPSTKKYANKSAAYIIRYKAVSEHGCSDSAKHRIVLLERPISNFDINDSIQCFRGHLFSFNNTTTFSAMNTLKYWWNYDNGDTSIGKLPKTAAYAQPNIYNVRLISYSSLTNCFDTLFKNVIPAPHANVKYTVNNDSQCFRYNKFVFANNSTVQFGSMKYRWSFGDNTFDTAKNPIKKYAVQGAYTVKVVATTNYDCADSTSAIIGFYATPKALFSIDDSLQCLNKQAFNFTDKTTLSKGTYTPSWWFDDNTTASSSQVNNKTFVAANYHNVRLSVITNKACVDTITQRVYLENIQNSRIVLSNKDSQCWKGNAFNFVNQKVNPRVNYTSTKWIYGDGQESTLNTPGTQKYNKDGEFTMLLCTESALGCFDTIRKLIVVHPHPVTAFNAPAVCYPEPVNFNNTSTITKGSIVENIWDFGDTEQGYLPSPVHFYPSSGLYNVRLQTVSNYGCRDTLVINNAANVQDKPKALFDFDQLSTIARDQTRLQFNNKSSSNATRYSWDFGNNTNSILQNPIGLFQDTGRWIVTLVSFTSEGCSDTFKLSTGAILPDFTYFLPNAFSPNGDVHNNLYRGEGSMFAYKFKMEIFNRWGEKLWESTDINQGWDGYYQGELCMQDVYFCRVQIVPFKGTLKTFEQSFYLLR